MSRYNQKFQLRCKGCYDEAFRRKNTFDAAIGASRAIEVIEAVGVDAVRCRCKNCGKVTVRRSKAAFRELRNKIEP